MRNDWVFPALHEEEEEKGRERAGSSGGGGGGEKGNCRRLKREISHADGTSIIGVREEREGGEGKRIGTSADRRREGDRPDVAGRKKRRGGGGCLSLGTPRARPPILLERGKGTVFPGAERAGERGAVGIEQKVVERKKRLSPERPKELPRWKIAQKKKKKTGDSEKKEREKKKKSEGRTTSHSDPRSKKDRYRGKEPKNSPSLFSREGKKRGTPVPSERQTKQKTQSTTLRGGRGGEL